MNTPIIAEKQLKIIIYILCIFHLVFWTLGSELFRGSVTHDTLESIAWGYQWQLGYGKHPFVAAWLAAFVTKVAGGMVGWPVYLLSQISIVVVFLANLSLAKKIMPMGHALVSVLLLEGVLYHNINSVNFTPDTAQIPLWALSALFFYNAVTTRKIKWWLLAGTGLALALLTKYSAIFLILSCGGVLLLTTVGRRNFKSSGIYIAAVVFIVMVSPHFIYSYNLGLQEFKYIQSSAPVALMWLDHIYYPFRYLRGQALIVLGVLILSWPLWNRGRGVIDNFNKQYILFMSLGPITLTTLYASVAGTHILQRWSTPYYYLVGMLLILVLKPVLTKKKLSQVVMTTFIVGLSICVTRHAYLKYGPSITGKATSDSYLPNQVIANKVTDIWRKRYNTKLSYIAGDHYLTAFIAAYSKDKPIPYFSLSKRDAPWVNEDAFKSKGSIIVWIVGESDFTSAKKRFPMLEKVGVFKFKKMVDIDVPPVEVEVALLPPSLS